LYICVLELCTIPFQPNLNELPIDSTSADNKENISRKRSLSDSTATPATASTVENIPPEKKVKVVDIVLDKDSSAAVPDVRQEPFVDGMVVGV